MKRYAPLLTILAVAVFGGVLLAVNSAGDPANQGAAAPAASPTAPDPPPTSDAPPAVDEVVYAGRSAGDEVTVAIAVSGGRAVGYVCDGAAIEAWLEGTVSGAEVRLASGDGSVSVTGSLDETASLGTVSVAEREWSYAADAVEAPAGLYEGRADVRGVANRIGWIVLDDGSQVGLLDAGGRTGPAPPLDPADPDGVEIDGVPVAVTTVGGDDEVITP
ncbi:MAG TPA: hypothetical protein VM367_15905 [Pseudonocardia sp.]|jgi:hypothetical protein|nr:hypothetical protein [Pseudonocardia sp.]